MSEKTIIAWTDHTFNPWMGCTKISEGCRNCYAATLTKNRMGLSLWGNAAPRQRTKSPWQHVSQWNRIAESGVMGDGSPRLCFTGSLMDWAEDRDDLIEVRKDMWRLIKASTNLHFQMLTKRTENIRRFLPEDWGNGYSNVWIGTTIEDMRVAHRADLLRDIPAVVRFVSYEPAIGPLDDLVLDGIDWVIYGGESGPGHRPEDKNWARVMRHKCYEAGVAFFHKQSAGYRTELGIELDGEIVREFPSIRALAAVA
jgi:protein gp37